MEQYKEIDEPLAITIARMKECSRCGDSTEKDLCRECE